MNDKIKGALVGLACGDAVGTTLEFKAKGSFKPIDDMVGGGPFNLKPGQWTDDTSMALCLAHSLVIKGAFDPSDQINRYCNWYEYGYMSSTGSCFDIGNTIASALWKYRETNDPFSGPTSETSSGNGSLMRLAPIPCFYHFNHRLCTHYAGESSRVTHGSAECIDSCKLFANLILGAFTSNSKHEIFENNKFVPHCDNVKKIAKLDLLKKSYTDLTASGYVIESLESAIWCFFNGNNFKECILLSANLGNDADTTAAICGQIAGAYYGFKNIPDNWVDKIAMSQDIQKLSIQLYTKGKESGPNPT